MALEDGNTIIIVSGSNVAPEHSVVLREDLAKALDEKENLGEGSGKTNSEHANNGSLCVTEMESGKPVTMDYNRHKIMEMEIEKDSDVDYDSVLLRLLKKVIKEGNPGITDEDVEALAEKRFEEIVKIRERYRKYSRSEIYTEKTSRIPNIDVVRDKSKKGKK